MKNTSGDQGSSRTSELTGTFVEKVPGSKNLLGADQSFNVHATRPLVIFSKYAGGLAFAAGTLVLLGWLFNVEVLKSLRPGFVTMKANTALCFIFSGVSLLFFHYTPKKEAILFFSHLLASLVALTGILTILEYMFSLNFGIDELLVRETGQALETYSPGRMALNTAVGFVLVGLSLVAANLKSKQYIFVSQVTALILAFISMVPLIGYIYGVSSFYQYSSFTSMALHTAITFFVLSMGIFCYRPDTAVLSVFTRDNLGGYMARRLMPLLLLIPFVLVWLRIAAESPGFYNSLFGLQLISSVIISVFIFLIWKVAKSINLLESDLRESANNLAQLNERFSLAAKAAHFGVWDWDVVKNQPVWDDRMYELYGVNRNGVSVEEAWLKGLHPEDMLIQQQEIPKVLSGEIDYDTEFRVVWPDGQIRYLKTFGQMLRDKNGKPVRMTGISYDITERKESEEALRKSEERFRTTMDNMIEGCQLVGFDWRYIYINKMAEKHNRKPKSEMLGQKMTDVWPGIERTKVYALEQKCMAERSVQHMENQFVFPDGSTGWFELGIQPMPEGIFILSVDITERKRTEKNLLASERKYKYLFENNPQPMWIFDVETRAFLEVNKSATRHYGYTREEFLEMSILDIRPPEDIEAVKAVSDITKIESHPGVWRHIKKNGEIIFVEIKAHLIDYEGRSARLVLANDVTERKKADEEIRKWNEELEQRVAERTRQLSESNKELESFAYSVSHDLRAPLRHVIGFSEKLERTLDSNGNSEIERLTGKIKNSASKMGQLIDELLAYSRLGRTDLKKRFVQLDEIVDEVVKDTSDLPGSDNIEWKIKKLPEVFADAMLIKLVFQNLINNAIKFSSKKESSAIEISCKETSKNKFTFMVKDNGAGFNMDYANKLFGVFQRLHSTDEFEGTGIGLATVRRIVSRHGGRVWAEGEEDVGATFYFTLPEKKKDIVEPIE